MLCPDCPDLMLSELPEGTVQRARCCRDEHLDRRLAGSFEPWQGIAQAREASAQDAARENRHQRRKREAQERKG